MAAEKPARRPQASMVVAWTGVLELDRSKRKDWRFWVGLGGICVWGNQDVFLGCLKARARREVRMLMGI